MPVTVRLASAVPEPTEPEKVVAVADAVSPKAPSTVPLKRIELAVRRSFVLSTTGPP